MKNKVITCTVKGNRYEAARAAADREIPFVFKKGLTDHTIGVVGIQFRDKIIEWFNEPPEGPPFPAGSLLLYTLPKVD